jgi:peptide maturation system protein (TIGR04066 family)
MVKKERAREKVIVYPYSAQFTPILRNKELIEDYEIAALVSPYGWGLVGRDAAWADGGAPIGIDVSDSFDETLEACDTVLLAESIYKLDYFNIIRPNIEKAVKAGKNIICTIQFEDDMYNDIQKLCKDNNVDIKYFNALKKSSKIADFRQFIDFPMEKQYYQLYNVETPVIFVAGMGERTNKFDIQLTLRSNLQKLGYKVGQIGSRSYCEILDFHSMPGFMYDSRVSDFHKIVLFNWFVKRIENTENPDVIIIGIPDGIMPLNRTFTGHFGVISYIISQAVPADALVLSTLFGLYKGDYFERMLQPIRYKLGCNITCFNLSNMNFDTVTSSEKSKEFYTTVDYKFVDEKIKTYTGLSTPVYNVLNADSASDMTNYIVNMLSGYGDVDAI